MKEVGSTSVWEISRARLPWLLLGLAGQLLAAVVLSRFEESPPLELPADNDLYAAVCALMGQEETVSVSYATDGGWFATAGFDCLIWGPGTIEVAHKPNESMPKAEYARASELLAGMVERFCASPAPPLDP